MVGTLHFEMCRNVPKRCVVSGVLVSSVLVLYMGFGQKKEAPMLASHLHLPTAAWGGHMGHFLLSVLILTSSTPLGNNHSVVRNYLACDLAERENRWERRRGQRWRSLRRWWRGVSDGRING